MHGYRIWLLSVLYMVTGYGVVGWASPSHTSKPISAHEYDQCIYQWSKIMAEVCYLVKNKYINLTNPDVSFKKALVAFTRELDPHSTFFDSKAYDSIKESIKGQLCGIGVLIDNTKEMEDEFIRVIDTTPTGPADKAGIKAEDKILAIDDVIVKGMTLEEAISKIKGKRNTPVSIRLQRSDTTRHLTFTINRDIVNEPNALCFHFVDQNIYYLSLNLFTENAIAQMEQLLKKIISAKGKGFILDLRNNSGGLVTSVVDIASFFLPKGSLLVSTKTREGKEDTQYITQKEPLFHEQPFPIFILVNNYTASAAEILAGCLKLYADESRLNRPIFLVGTETFGKGSVQEVIPLSNDSLHDCALKITTHLYYLPNNESIQGKGITPDFVIQPRIQPSQESMWFNEKFGKESSLKNAIKNDQHAINPMVSRDSGKAHKQELEKNKKEKSWLEKKKDLIAEDYLILSTVRLMSMFTMMAKAMPEAVQSRTKAIQTLKVLYLPDDNPRLGEVEIPSARTRK